MILLYLILFTCKCAFIRAFVAYNLEISNSHLKASAADYAFLKERIKEMRLHYIAIEMQRPPNPQLSAQGFCLALLECLRSPDDPWPDSGFRTLLRSSTTKWRTALYKSVGACFPETSIDSVASALSYYISDERNKFQLLVQPTLKAEFPSEICDFMDGTCWVECHLRTFQGKVLVIVGFSLKKERDVWMLDGIDWNDIRSDPLMR
jgi:hypothetical protein